MKLTCLQNVKFQKIKRRLRLSHWQAVGLLESLWLFTQTNSPRGDLGRHSNEDIAAGIEWDGDADELIRNLVECGWLDECDEGRLIVHDWMEHMPTYLKGALAKAEQQRAKQPAKQPAKHGAKQPAKQPAESSFEAADCLEQPAPSLTLPNHTLPNHTEGGHFLPSPAHQRAMTPLEENSPELQKAIAFWNRYWAETEGCGRPCPDTRIDAMLAEAMSRGWEVEKICESIRVSVGWGAKSWRDPAANHDELTKSRLAVAAKKNKDLVPLEERF